MNKLNLTPIHRAIILALRDWSNKDYFDYWWGGYSELSDKIYDEKIEGITLFQCEKELRFQFKILRDLGVIESKPIFDDDLKLNGKGWFLTKRYIEETK